MMKSLRCVVALIGMLMLTSSAAWAADARAPLPAAVTAQKSAQAVPAEVNLLAQSDSRKACVDPILACRKACNTQSKPGSDEWKACRNKCGNPGNCD